MNTEVSDDDIVQHMVLDPPSGYPETYSLEVINGEICLNTMGSTMVKLRNNTGADLSISTYDWNEGATPPGIYGIRWI